MYMYVCVYIYIYTHIYTHTHIYIYVISAFLEFHLKPLAQKVKSYIKDTNDFLRKVASFHPLPGDIILCTIDIVGLYPNIPHDEGFIALRKSLQDNIYRLPNGFS